MSNPLDWIDAESAEWSARGLTRTLKPVSADPTGKMARDGRSLINFASNDYLGLAQDPRVIAAAIAASHEIGWGAGASALVTGWSQYHEQLSRDLAQFEKVEAATLFPTGYAANVGTITALVGKPDAIYSDRLNHACLIDGARLSSASIRVYEHANASSLEEMLKSDQGKYRRSLIITDGVFSMDGDLAPLRQLVDLAENYQAMLLVDEAHGTGVFGPDGRGAASECSVAERITIRVGTLSKALGSVGGFVAGPAKLIDWLINHARPLIFSTASPAAAAAAASAALKIVQNEPERRVHLKALGDRVRTALGDQGYTIVPSIGPIVPVVIGDSHQAVAFSSKLADAGFLIPAIRPPTVPEGSARLRICLSARHTDVHVDRLILAFSKARS
jgi:8-amino-7-oxononanoate synthase